MKYFDTINGLAKEAFAKKQYKQMGRPFSVFAFIGVLPYFITSLLLGLVFYVYLIFFNALSAASDYLDTWLGNTRQGVKHATEAVLYLVSVPAILVIKVALAIFTALLFVLWFLVQCCVYIVSLGGIRWQPNLATADYNGNTTYVPTTGRITARVFSLISFCAFIIYVLLNVYVYFIDPFNTLMINILSLFTEAYDLFLIISVPLMFKKRIVSGVEEECEANADESENDEAIVLPEIQ